MATTYLEMTQGTPTSTRKCTYSGWLKKCEISPSVSQSFFSIGLSGDTHYNDWRFETDDIMYINIDSAAGYTVSTNRKFRDVGAWYHVVIAIDTEQSVAADRVKLYINGVQETDLDSESYPVEDYDIPTLVSGDKFSIGRRVRTGTMYFNGNMSWVQFVDGLQLAPTEFGAFDSTSGIWKIKPTVYATPGTNGFCLKMEDRTNLDLDTSSNAHTFTTSGTLTPTYDNPSNNFCTQNFLQRSDTSSQPTLSNGNTTGIYTSTAGWRTIPGTMAVNKGKWYWEVIGGNSSGHLYPAVCSPNWFNGGDPGSYGVSGEPGVGNAGPGSNYQPSYGVYPLNGNLMWQTDSATGTDESYAASTARETDYWGVFLDCDNLKLYYTINGVIQNSGTGFDIQSGFYYHPAIGYYNTQAIGTSVNWGNGVFFSTLLTGTTYTDDDGIGMFKYSPNYGGGANFDGSAKNFYALCTKNLKAYGG